MSSDSSSVPAIRAWRWGFGRLALHYWCGPVLGPPSFHRSLCMLRSVVKRNPALLRPPRNDPRPNRDPEYVRRLAEDIARRGLRHSPYIVQRGEVEEIVTGEHRRLAMVLLGWPEADFYLLDGDLSEADLTFERLLEAEVHSSFSWLQKAAVYQQLLQGGMTRAEIAERLGTCEPEISKAFRIKGNLAPDLQADLEAGKLPVSCAYLLATLPDHDAQRAWAQKVYAGQIKRDALQAKVRGLLGQAPTTRKAVKGRTPKGLTYQLPADFATALAELAALADAVKKAERLSLPLSSVPNLLRSRAEP
jgi:ParB-like chromosome segregation protein Spo0J